MFFDYIENRKLTNNNNKKDHTYAEDSHETSVS